MDSARSKLFITILLCSIGVAAAAEVKVRVVRHKNDVPAPPGAALVTNIITLLHWCSVDSTAYTVKAETWQEIMRSDSFVHVTFSAPCKISVESSNNHGRAERLIDEILVPLPEGKWPAHLFAKSGANVPSYTKYDPRDLKSVALEPALQLSSVTPYSDLAKFPDRQR